MYMNRREDILRLLNQQPTMAVKDLSDQLDVSEMTIRRDLNKMEEEGVVKRCFGGVSLAKGLLVEQSIPVRAANMPAAKRRMAAMASQLVQDGDSVLLDSGTTILELAKLLASKRITIATSSLLIAMKACRGAASIHVSGGELDVGFQTLTGRKAEAFYESINCKYAFVSAGGVSLKRGITEFTEDAAALSMVGPFARASNLPYDVRSFGRGAYGDLADFAPITATEGDCYARVKVRCLEVLQSIEIIKELGAKIPAGDIEVAVKGAPADGAQASNVLEQPRGECYYYARGNGSKYLERMRMRTPTSQNLAGMTVALKGCDLADVNMIILTIDPCISCTER